LRGGARKGAGRPVGSLAKRKRKTTTISLWPESWKALDKIGPSRGKAVEKLLRFWQEHH